MLGLTPRATVRNVTLVALLLIAVSQPVFSQSESQDDLFPVPESIRTHVEFWKNVFGRWQLGQVVVHDLEYPSVVYAVVDLPGTIEQNLAKDQGKFIDDLTEEWIDRLKAVEQKVRSGDELSEREKAWVLNLTTHAGTNAVKGAHERIRTQRGLRERFLRGLEISFRFDAKIREAFRSRGVPEDLAFLPHVESSFQYAARSSAGAVGAWQFTRGTGRLYMPITTAFDARLDPLAAAGAAADYLKNAYAELQTWPLALTSYNHGVAGMKRARDKHGDYEEIFLNYNGRSFGFASKNFYSEFLAARELASQPETFFAGEYTPEPQHDLDSIILTSTTTPARLATAFDLPIEELVAINPGWTRRAIVEGLALPSEIVVWLPVGTHERLAVVGHTPDYALSGWIDGGGFYIVQPGDTLSLVAQTYELSVTTIRELNGLESNQSLIRVGQRLRLGDSPTDKVHVVRRGESLSSIAQAYRMPIAALRGLNGLAPNESRINIGQKLRVSGALSVALHGQIHVVRRGETLGRIAGNYGVKLVELLNVNGLSERAVIRPGQKIRIPS